MRGDQLARESWTIRAIEASPNGLTVAEVAKPDGAQGGRTNEKPSKACSKTGIGFFVLGNRRRCAVLMLGLYETVERTDEAEQKPFPCGLYVSIKSSRSQ